MKLISSDCDDVLESAIAKGILDDMYPYSDLVCCCMLEAENVVEQQGGRGNWLREDLEDQYLRLFVQVVVKGRICGGEGQLIR